MSHDLKCWPMPFEAILDGRKVHEFRRDDRDFALGDVLFLREWDPVLECYTGRSTYRKVTYMTRGPDFGVPDGYVVLSLRTP